MSDELPPGVDEFDVELADPTGNIILDVSGAPKTGKSHFAAHAARPLYIVYSDPNTNLDAILLKADDDLKEAGLATEPVFRLVMEPVPYEDLTRDEAVDRMAKAQQFAAWARQQGKGGTFIVDGGTYLKGYFEKAILGESATLGFRAAKGQKGPSPIEYAKSNTALKDFVSGFVGSDLDVILTWEGKEIWKENWADGRMKREPTGKFKTGSPPSLGFVTSAYIETVMVLEPQFRLEEGVKVPSGTKVAHRIRIGPNGYNPALYDMLLPVENPDELKSLLFAQRAVPEEIEGATADGELKRVDPEVANAPE